MEHVMRGLTKEAQAYLADKRAMPGEPCWCCGLPLPETAPTIETVKRGDYSFDLHRYLMRENGWVCEEYIQAETVANGKTYYYLALRVKPDGILAHGDGRTIQWPAEALLDAFPGGK